MTQPRLKTLSDMAEVAHARVQQAHADINPVIALRRGMRDIGVPADVMTIDCLRTRHRILLLLHDEQPDSLLYQFTTLDEEMTETWERMAFSEISTDLLMEWMQGYFSSEPQ